MTLTFVLEKKRKVVFDSDEEMMERLESEPVRSTDLGVSSPVEEDESGGRDTLSATPQMRRESQSLSILLA